MKTKQVRRGGSRGNGRRSGRRGGSAGRGRRGGPKHEQRNGRDDKGTKSFAPNDSEKTNSFGKAMFEGVDEAFKIKFSATIERWRESEEEELVFPPNLSSKERKFVHHIANKLGVKSKSRGKGESRFLTLSRNSKKERQRRQIIYPKPATMSIIQKHFQCYPFGKGEVTRSRRAPKARILSKSAIRKRKNARVDPKRLRERFESSKRRIEKSPKLNTLRKSRRKLPVSTFRRKIMDAVACDQVTVISGQTGTGKSTQVPQFILEDDVVGPTCNVVCTQPRRISAVGLAHRVAEERGEEVGDTVGYSIRLERSTSPCTQLLFCTTGVLLRKMMQDPMMEDVTHIIVDEVHERDAQTDFLLILLRDIVLSSRRKDLKIILMSATIQVAKFSDYFDKCPIVQVPGRTFDVDVVHLEHVLAFVGFADDTSRTNAEESAARADSSVQSASMFTTTEIVFTCPGCRERFNSAEDMGAHSVFCFAVPEERECEEESADDVSIIADDHDGNCTTDEPVALTVLETVVSGSNDQASDTFADGENKVNEHVAKLFGDSKPPRVCTDDVLRYQGHRDDETADIYLVESVLENIYTKCGGKPDGAVLIFLTGWSEISSLTNILSDHEIFGDANRCTIAQLHSLVSTSKQRLAFKRPPKNCWKIVLSTNIAETSITIPDVVYVIDCGKAKKRLFDPYTNMSTFRPHYISQASAKQRQGRAGRCQKGLCIRLYTTTRYESFDAFELPEMLRVPLEEIMLQAMQLLRQRSLMLKSDCNRKTTTSRDAIDFLSRALDSPNEQAIHNATLSLCDIGALCSYRASEEEAQELTIVGDILAKLPIHPRLGKMVLLASFFGVCDPVLTIVCAASYRSPFVLPTNNAEQQRARKCMDNFVRRDRSDHVALLRAYDAWSSAYTRKGRRGAEQFCRKHFLSPNTMYTIRGMRRQLLDHLKRLRFPIQTERESILTTSKHLLTACVCAGLFPNIGVRIAGSKNVCCAQEKKARVHFNSVNSKLDVSKKSTQRGSHDDEKEERELEWIAFERVTRGIRRCNIESTTIVDPYAIILLCGNLGIKRQQATRNGGDETSRGFSVIDLNPFISFHLQDQTAALLRVMRCRLQSYFWDFLATRAKSKSASALIELCAETLRLEG